jgi:hypothetical protein
MPRSGTTVFRTMLASHPEIADLGEVLNEGNRAGFFHHLAGLASKDVNWVFPSKTVAAFEDYVETAGARTASWKPAAVLALLDIKYTQFHLIRDPWQDPRDLTALLSLVKKNRWRVFDVYRKNVLGMMISNHLAMSSGVYHVQRGDVKRVDLGTITLEVDSLLADIKAAVELYKRIYEFFQGYDYYMRVRYEDMFDASGMFNPDLLSQLASFLRVPNAFDPIPNLTKIVSSDPLDYVTNGDEVRAALEKANLF